MLHSIDTKTRKFEEESTNYKAMLESLFTAAAHEFETDSTPRTPRNAQRHKRLEVKLKLMTMKDSLFKEITGLTEKILWIYSGRLQNSSSFEKIIGRMNVVTIVMHILMHTFNWL